MDSSHHRDYPTIHQIDVINVLNKRFFETAMTEAFAVLVFAHEESYHCRLEDIIMFGETSLFSLIVVLPLPFRIFVKNGFN